MQILKKLAQISALLLLSLCSTYAIADRGIIVVMTPKCFVIQSDYGYTIVDGWVSARKGDELIGDFNTYGSTKIFDVSGRDVSGYIYIEEYGLSRSRLEDKWRDKYASKCGR